MIEQKQKQKPSFKSSRTEEMVFGIENCFPGDKFKEFFKYDNQQKLWFIYQNKKYLVVTNDANFSENLASIGKLPKSREILIVNHESKYLITLINQLKSACSSEDDIPDIMRKVKNFVDYQFINLRPTLTPQNIIDDWKKKQKSIITTSQNKTIAVIPLEHFLEKGIGNCRHHALLIAILLTKLIEQKQLPAGRVYLCRDNFFSRGCQVGHAWNIYFAQPENKFFWIDTTFSVIEEIDAKSMRRLQFIYGKQIIDNIKSRYNIQIETSNSSDSETSSASSSYDATLSFFSNSQEEETPTTMPLDI